MSLKLLMSNYLVWISLLPLSLDILYTRFLNYDEIGFYRYPESIIFTFLALCMAIFTWYHKTKITYNIPLFRFWIFIFLANIVYVIFFIDFTTFNGKYTYVLLLVLFLIATKPLLKNEVEFAIGFFMMVVTLLILLSLIITLFFPDFTLSGHASRIGYLKDYLPSRMQGIFGGPGILGLLCITVGLYYSVTKRNLFSWILVIGAIIVLILSDSRAALVSGLLTSGFIILHKYYRKVKIQRRLWLFLGGIFIYLFLLGANGVTDNYKHRILLWTNALSSDSISQSDISQSDISQSDISQSDTPIKNSDPISQSDTPIKKIKFQLSHNFVLDAYQVGGFLYVSLILLIFCIYFYFIIFMNYGNYISMAIGMPTFIFSMFEFGIIPSKLNIHTMLIILSVLLVISSKTSVKKI